MLMNSLPSLPFALAEGPGDSFNPVSIWQQASLFNQGVIILLLLLVLLQIYIAIERGVVYWQSRSASNKFLRIFMETLRRGDFEAAKNAAAAHGKSHVALVLKHGLDIYQYEKQLKQLHDGHDGTSQEGHAQSCHHRRAGALHRAAGNGGWHHQGLR
jgi:biopolymer transport protein ExbB/biopolymer transport protein TolQ